MISAGGQGCASEREDHQAPPCARMVHAAIPGHLWSGVFFSWMSMKGHLQSLADMNRTEMFATSIGDLVYATFITVWNRQENVLECLKHDYPVETMLRHMGVEGEDITVTMASDYS